MNKDLLIATIENIIETYSDEYLEDHPDHVQSIDSFEINTATLYKLNNLLKIVEELEDE